MKRMHIVNAGFSALMVALSALLSWGGMVVYKMQVQHLRTETEATIQDIAQLIQEHNVTTLNNLANIIQDTDFAEKTAFAAGITGNTGKIRTWFDENIRRSEKRGEEQERRSGQKILKISHEFVESRNLRYKPEYDLGIKVFDSCFKKRLQERDLTVHYKIHYQTPLDTLPFDSRYSYSSPVFILSFYNPKVYRVDYNIPPIAAAARIWLYVLICLLLLCMLYAGFIFTKRSYKMQAQMAEFREGLFSNITHELKTPLSSLQLILQEVSATQPMPAQYIAYARSELNRMKLIVEKILAFGKINKEQFELNKEIVAVEDVIQDAIEAMDVAINSSSAKVLFEASDKHYLPGDRLLLTNTIITLIDNALKYNNQTPLIEIIVTDRPATIDIEVKDNGIGIDPQYHKEVFKPFFRVPTGDVHEVKGHGLGLSFAAQVVALHQGSISILSSGHGTIIHLKLSKT